MATPTAISKQNKPAASKPKLHKASLTNHAHALEAGILASGLFEGSGAVSWWGIGLGEGAASGLPDVLHYKNSAEQHSSRLIYLNTLSL